jgi:hypothetical protein
MSIFTRLLNRFHISRLDRDFRDEIEFHIEMRASQYRKEGLPEEEAMRRAHEQFGDTDAATRGMRRARVTSVTALLTVSSVLAALIIFWSTQELSSPANLRIPDLPAPPLVIHLDPKSDSPPPPPPPSPTWEEFAAKVNTFERSPNEKAKRR